MKNVEGTTLFKWSWDQKMCTRVLISEGVVLDIPQVIQDCASAGHEGPFAAG